MATEIPHDVYAQQAVRAHRAMTGKFRKRNGMYRYDEGPMLRSAAQLWPFGRALMATLDVAGIDPSLVADIDTSSEIAEHLQALENYWDPAGPRPAYCADSGGPSRRGDRYYDDNAWIGLALIELERLRPGSGQLDRAGDLFQFAVQGWDSGGGGVFWCEQGRGTGMRNHDRNTVSNAPNAELGLHLAELGQRAGGDGVDALEGELAGPGDMYQWVLANLDQSRGTDSPGTGLFIDKLRGDGTVDRATWSYNQGSMIGANVLLARRRPADLERYLGLAEAIARKSLRKYAGDYGSQSAAFHAIFFRNLLLLHAATDDEELQSAIIDAIRGYADGVWSQARDRHDLFALKGRPALLDQASIVQVLALLAWAPESYGRLA